MSNILILEDDIALGYDFYNAFKERGHEVQLVSTATDALAYCKTAPICLAIVDIFIRLDDRYIPDGGLSFIAKIRQLHLNPALRDLPIIAISGGSLVAGENDPLKSASSIGATATLKKPIQITELISTADDILGLDDY